MDMLKKLSPAAQAVLGGSVLYLIFSFFDWQQACGNVGGIDYCVGRTEWNGIGVIAGLLAIALIAWEVIRLLGMKIELGSFSPQLLSVALAVGLLVFTVITFLDHNEIRHWPSWIGLLLSIVIAGAALSRGKAEGVKMPDLGAMKSGMGGGSSGGSAAPPPPPPSPPSTPAETPPADTPGDTPSGDS